MQCILTGDISITDNLQFVQEILFNNSIDTKIISLDENNSLPLDHPRVLGGKCLLPPIDALIAAEDGDEASFDMFYSENFMNPFTDQFVGAMIIYLMRGGNLLLYYPEFKCTAAGPKILDQFWRRYGINIGIIGERPHYYDVSCTPIWLNYAYSIGNIDCKNYLYLYPEGATIPDNIMYRLISELSLYVDGGYENLTNYIYGLVHKYKEKPNLIIPIRAAQ